jgi:hypothetical protein
MGGTEDSASILQGRPGATRKARNPGLQFYCRVSRSNACYRKNKSEQKLSEKKRFVPQAGLQIWTT